MNHVEKLALRAKALATIRAQAGVTNKQLQIALGLYREDQGYSRDLDSVLQGLRKAGLIAARKGGGWLALGGSADTAESLLKEILPSYALVSSLDLVTPKDGWRAWSGRARLALKLKRGVR